MPIHDAQHPPTHPDGRALSRNPRAPNLPRAPIAPHPDRHIITRAEHDVAPMRAPRDLPHRVLVPAELRHGGARIPEVPGADDAVDARGAERVRTVLVPIEAEEFHLRGLELDLFLGGLRGIADVVDAGEAVGGDAGEGCRGAGLPGDAVGAGADWDGGDGAAWVGVRAEELDRAVP